MTWMEYLKDPHCKTRVASPRIFDLGRYGCGLNPKDHSVDSRVQPADVKMPKGLRFLAANVVTLAARGPSFVCKLLGTSSVAI